MACADGEQIVWEEQSQDDINSGVLFVVLTVAFTTLAGTALDAFLAHRRKRQPQEEQCEERAQQWSIFLLVSSYALLIPGLTLNIFGFGIIISLFGMDKTVAGETDTTWGVVRSLWTRDARVGAVLIAVYAFVVPLVKLLLLFAGKVCSRSKRPGRAWWARRCIRVVQEISKWASPDVFAYILLTYLIRTMDHPPTLRTSAQLDVGFTCFSLFCVGSTLSSLWLRMPDKETLNAQEGEAVPLAARCGAIRQKVSGFLEFELGGLGFLKVSNLMCASLLGLFAFFFVKGIVMSALVLQLDMDVLYEKNPCLVPFAPLIDGLNLPALMHSEATLWDVTSMLHEWGSAGDSSSWVAFIMVGLFAVVFPILDVMFLTFSFFQLRRDSSSSKSRVNLQRKRHHVFSKMSMLDVFIMGTVVVALALTSLRDKGLVVTLESGCWYLAAAEACHYAIYGLLACTAASQKTPATKEDGATEATMSDKTDVDLQQV